MGNAFYIEVSRIWSHFLVRDITPVPVTKRNFFFDCVFLQQNVIREVLGIYWYSIVFLD